MDGRMTEDLTAVAETSNNFSLYILKFLLCCFFQVPVCGEAFRVIARLR